MDLAELNVAARCLRGALADGRLNLDDRAEVAIDFTKMAAPGACGMRMRVYETGDDGLAFKVDLLRPRRRKPLNLVVRANSQEASVRDRDCPRTRIPAVDGQDVAL
jgi:hypothetical protein